jgi:hypothetical protein
MLSGFFLKKMPPFKDARNSYILWNRSNPPASRAKSATKTLRAE